MEAILETFKPVVGFEGLYQVSNCGAVRSLKFKGKKRIKYLRNTKQPNGYECICLFRDGKKKTFSVHRLVWEAFVGKIPNGLQIDHINTVRDDNRLVNLRLVTSKENHSNPITAERNREANKRRSQDPEWQKNHREGTRKARNKHVFQIDKQTGEVIRKWECAADVERELGINNRNISTCCNNKRKSAGGFKWRFASD